MIPTQVEELYRTFWDKFNKQFNLTHAEGCGQFTEAWVKYAQNHGWAKVGHLKKNPSQTQYNGHAVDAFLYADGTDNEGGLFSAIDIIASAEAKPPYTPSNPAPSINFGVDTPSYTIKDWLKEPGGSQPVPQTVPYVPYNEGSFQRLKNMLIHDYGRRPQDADFDVAVWAARMFHNQYMGPEGTPLGEQKALERIKPELCDALGISNDGYLG